MTYSQSSDMLLGDLPLVSANADKYVQDASDEIDSKLGFTYVTPMVLTGSPRPVQLLIKRINNFLATGRYILAVASPTEQQALHAYGKSLVDSAESSLASIVCGDIVLDGVPRVDSDGTSSNNGPVILNQDPESMVDAFYDRVANPNYGVVVSTPYGGTSWVR